MVHERVVGLYIYGDTESHNCLYALIASNTSNTITTNTAFGYTNAWSDVLYVGSRYKIGDLSDGDTDGWHDDEGYLNDLVNDDDENGYPDDLRGWDFIDDVVPEDIRFPNEDYEGEDYNPVDRDGHGTGGWQSGCDNVVKWPNG